jgi:hypothetical protein
MEGWVGVKASRRFVHEFYVALADGDQMQVACERATRATLLDSLDNIGPVFIQGNM